MPRLRREAAPPIKDEARELIDLVRRYVIQETLTPIKTLGRSLGFGLAGGLLCGIGFIFCLIGVLRTLENETGTTFAGNWSFAPYLLTALVGFLTIAACIAIALRSPKGEAKSEAR